MSDHKLISAADKELTRENVLNNVGKGWSKIVDDLITDLFKMGWDGHVHQVKEKFGSLRFYTGATSEEMDLRIRVAERQSALTCEECGEAGSIRYTGWYLCLCEEHIEQRLVTLFTDFILNYCRLLETQKIKPNAIPMTVDDLTDPKYENGYMGEQISNRIAGFVENGKLDIHLVDLACYGDRWIISIQFPSGTTYEWISDYPATLKTDKPEYYINKVEIVQTVVKDCRSEFYT